MPTLRKGYRRQAKEKLPNAEKKMISVKPQTRAGKVGDALKKGATTVIKGYLKGTQKLADKVQSVLPETTYDRSGNGGRGRRGRGGR